MSTNYYWRHNLMWDGECFDELHIGHFATGSFSFQGHFDDKGEPLIVSWAQWQEKLRSQGYVWNENGYEVPVEEFIADVESVEILNRRRQYDWLLRHYGRGDTVHVLDVIEPYADWLDADGFSFHGGEFS